MNIEERLQHARDMVARLRAQSRRPRVGIMRSSDLERAGTWSVSKLIGDPGGEAAKLERAITRLEQAAAGLDRAISSVPDVAFQDPPLNTGRRRRRVRRRTAGARDNGYQVNVLPKAEKSMDKLPREISRRVVDTIAKITERPRTNASRIDSTQSWTGYPYLLMARVGKYRVLYWVDDHDHVITIVDVLLRKKLPGGTNGR